MEMQTMNIGSEFVCGRGTTLVKGAEVTADLSVCSTAAPGETSSCTGRRREGRSQRKCTMQSQSAGYPPSAWCSWETSTTTVSTSEDGARRLGSAKVHTRGLT